MTHCFGFKSAFPIQIKPPIDLKSFCCYIKKAFVVFAFFFTRSTVSQGVLVYVGRIIKIERKDKLMMIKVHNVCANITLKYIQIFTNAT